MSYISLGEFDDHEGDAGLAGAAPWVSYEPAEIVEVESAKTAGIKRIIEDFCVKSPGYQLQWKVERVKVDVRAQTLPGESTKTGRAVDPRRLPHTGTLYTLW
ncbi:CDK-activating kinase assembly factor [Babesia caballi]|uniref:CDK-activating kinase assembly factor n=1 Tax=Babesia caballi TaxID=5871 RepID=A0AAV4LVW9_BABCB|nr:CDK-activating kinase assembly factor [Babesia caballi]